MSQAQFKAAKAALALLCALNGPALFAQAATDGDRDGIADASDDCPYTPAGARVDRTGCALDEDFDGVADGLDRCNGTPLGAVVESDGCAKDQISAGASPAPAAAALPPPPPPPPPPTAVVNPFSTQPSAPIQAYPIGDAPTPAQVGSGAASVPPPPPFPVVPDPVRDELDARASGKTIVNLPVARDTGASATAQVSTPPPAPTYSPVSAPVYLYQRPIVTAAQRLSTESVAPLTPRVRSTVTTWKNSTTYDAPVPFGGGAPVDPFATPAAISSPRISDWTLQLEGAQADGSAEQTLREAAGAIKQAQRENPFLSYEIIGTESGTNQALAYLAAQGVAISRLRLKNIATAGGKVVIRPASD